MKCPECGEELDTATYTESTGGFVDLKQSNGKTIVVSWNEEPDKEIYFYCPNCGEDITSEILIQ